ncbi:MAG: hypothetical protein UU32_C0032G0001 [Candidatus Woesebacteria bacterium GW2011_GWB1_41_10]|uniref:SGNH hydrolase-type esterase domain-containing protein n=1 Tax=Candidatus Woesebacteria bacterium GW2011_GWB1_41_10 TaxID=1618577 RepID=A0A0G0XDL7_9BACT|nr:MAG: hypothetical protein UU32_C0032G0001 [Candidatus Woesebacteria bacterium GW2011_GWB1_41_10]
MVRKLLVILPVILVFEFSLYLLQVRQIKKLDQKMQFSAMSARRVNIPSRGFGNFLAYQFQPEPEVLAVATEAIPATKKQSYVIAAIGDSMIETMGDSLDYLKAALKEKYPGTEFAMYNYGIGAEKVTGALSRLDKPFIHGTRNYPPLTHLNPDILIVGSYAYNPFDQYSRDGHWLALTDLVIRARGIVPNTYLLAEVAPLEKDFGKGPGGVNWPDEIVAGHTPKIIEQMENAIGISKILGISLINVYDKTRVRGSKYGKTEYVNPHDNIHPSAYGQVFTAKQAAEVIRLD